MQSAFSHGVLGFRGTLEHPVGSINPTAVTIHEPVREGATMVARLEWPQMFSTPLAIRGPTAVHAFDQAQQLVWPGAGGKKLWLHVARDEHWSEGFAAQRTELAALAEKAEGVARRLHWAHSTGRLASAVISAARELPLCNCWGVRIETQNLPVPPLAMTGTDAANAQKAAEDFLDRVAHSYGFRK